jgi:hypothetical protein
VRSFLEAAEATAKIRLEIKIPIYAKIVFLNNLHIDESCG